MKKLIHYAHIFNNLNVTNSMKNDFTLTHTYTVYCVE